jgi:hypothetical protein
MLAPPVKHPLDASKYVKPETACKVLVVNQLKKLGLAKPVSRNGSGPLGSGCTWFDRAQPSTSKAVGLPWESVNKRGLSDIYSNRADWSKFEPIEVPGYPAVRGDPFSTPDPQSCYVAVGVASDESFTASIDEGSPDEAYKPAKATASAVIDTLKKANK